MCDFVVSCQNKTSNWVCESGPAQDVFSPNAWLMRTRTLLDRSRPLYASLGRGKLGHTILFFLSAEDFPVAAAKFPWCMLSHIVGCNVIDGRQFLFIFILTKQKNERWGLGTGGRDTGAASCRINQLVSRSDTSPLCHVQAVQDKYQIISFCSLCCYHPLPQPLPPSSHSWPPGYFPSWYLSPWASLWNVVQNPSVKRAHWLVCVTRISATQNSICITCSVLVKCSLFACLLWFKAPVYLSWRD